MNDQTPKDPRGDFAPTKRTRIKRMPKRAHYDRDTVNAILDAGVIAHVGYNIDGEPYVTPTAYWRKGDHVGLSFQKEQSWVLDSYQQRFDPAAWLKS